MCLYVDDYNYTLLAEGERQARKEHRCDECGRTIEPGERYQYWVGIDHEFDGFTTQKMCAHCWGTIELGAALTGCPKYWYWGTVHDLDEEQGFVGNILKEPAHRLSFGAQVKMMRTVRGRRHGWRGADGTLLPVPAVSRTVIGGSP